MTFLESPHEAKLWVIQQIAQFIHDTEGNGSFRKLIYEYLDLDYGEAYMAGGMVITNTLSHENYKEFNGKVFSVEIEKENLE